MDCELSSLGDLQSSLRSSCWQLEAKLQAAQEAARHAAADGMLRLEGLAASLQSLAARISGGISGGISSGSSSSKVGIVQELGDLAKDVSRLGEARKYVEAVLQLERLVGDLEDSVSASLASKVVTSSSRSSLDAQAAAVKSLKSIETLVGTISRLRPQWLCLLSAVDIRVDRAVAILRPAVVSKYRSALASAAWPPHLNKQPQQQEHPFLRMQDTTKLQYTSSFMTLSALQAIIIQRRARARDARGARELLWCIEELVLLLAAKCEVHFKSWQHQPEFVFLLAWKVAQDHIAAVETILQPMLDEALLPYSAREHWVAAVGSMVCEHLRKSALPSLIHELTEEDGFSSASLQREAGRVWLQTVDEAICFDRKMQALALGSSGIGDAEDEELNDVSVYLPCISVFGDRLDWLELWAKLETDVVTRKVKTFFDEDVLTRSQQSSLFRCPAAAEEVMLQLWSAMERCKALPQSARRFRFVTMTAGPIVDRVLEELWQRCHEAEALTALADEQSASKVAVCVNTARFCECTLKDWSESVFLLELNTGSHLEGSVLDEEIKKLSEFQTAWLAKLSSVLLRGFEAQAKEYFRNKKRWSEESEMEAEMESEITSASPALVDALVVLREQVEAAEKVLEQTSFVQLRQKLVPALDQLVFQSVVLSAGTRFSDLGGRQFAYDVGSLMGIFRRRGLVRLASLFPLLSGAVKLLTLPRDEVDELLDKLLSLLDFEEEEDEVDLEVAERVLCQRGVRRMSPEVAIRVLRCRDIS